MKHKVRRIRRALYYAAGIVYGPLLLVGYFFAALAWMFAALGGWVHDLMIPTVKAPTLEQMVDALKDGRR